MELNRIKQAEEAKRDAAYDPAARWLHLQQTITWAEENMPAHLRRNRPRIHPSQAVSTPAVTPDHGSVAH